MKRVDVFVVVSMCACGQHDHPASVAATNLDAGLAPVTVAVTPSASAVTSTAPIDAGPPPTAHKRRPSFVIPTGSMWKQVTLTCVDVDTHSEIVSCGGTDCTLRYVATRVEQSPAGYRVLARDAGVDRELALGTGARVEIFRDHDALHAHIQDSGVDVLRFDGQVSDAGATEGSTWEDFVGVVYTPGAVARAFAGSSTAGTPTTPLVTRDEYRAGAKCTLMIDDHAE